MGPIIRRLSLPKPHIRDPRDVRLLSLLRQQRGSQEAQVGLLALPYDGASLGRKGASEGPKALLEALRFFSSYSPPDVDLRALSIHVFGEAALQGKGVREAHRIARRAALQVLRLSRVGLFLGGDHSLTYPCFAALLSLEPRAPALVYFDAHLDLRRGPPSSGNGIGRALALARGRVAAVNVGARPFSTAQAYFRRARELGLTVITSQRAMELEEGLAEELLRLISGADALYISVDADVLDAPYAPGVSSPGISGFTPLALGRCLFELARRCPLRAVDFCELAPRLDPSGVTALSLAHALAWLLAGLAQKLT